MSFTTELDVINDMLATMGETPVAQLDDEHPLISAGRRRLKTVSWREQGKGWWFNQEEVTLQTDTSGFLYVPADTLSIDPLDVGLPYIHRGRRLYNPKTGSYVFPAGTEVLCGLVRFVPFDDLPANAASYVSACALYDFQADYDADEAKMRRLEKARNQAYLIANAEHIRNRKANMLNRNSTLQRVNALGFSGTGSVLTVR